MSEDTCAYLVAIKGSQPSLWRLGFYGKSTSNFRDGATKVWENAFEVAKSNIRWCAFQTVSTPTVQIVAGQSGSGLEGRSFGLSFALAIFARGTGARLPLDFVASAELCSDGALKGVEGLDNKMYIASRQPGVKFFFVAKDDESTAKDSARGMEVLAFETFDQVLDFLRLSPDVKSPVRGRALLTSLTHRSLGDRAGQKDFKGIRSAYDLMREQSWLTADDSFVLDVCLRVAKRHDDVSKGPPPDPAGMDLLALQTTLDGLAQPLRSIVLRNLLREAYDVGLPRFEDLRPHVLPLVRTNNDAFPDEIALSSAFSQCLWLSGDVAGGFQLATQCIEAWSQRQTPEQASYALTTIFQCAWLDPSLLEEAESIYQTHHVSGLSSAIYCQLARARAHGLQNSEEGLRILEETKITLDSLAPKTHPRGSRAYFYLRISHQRLSRYFGSTTPINRPFQDRVIEDALHTLDQIHTLLVNGEADSAEELARRYFLETPGIRQAILLNAHHPHEHFAPFILRAFPY